MALIDDARRRGLIDQIPTGGLQSPAADGSQNNPLNTSLGREVTNTLSAIPGAGGVPGAVARGAGLVGRAFGAAQAAAPAAQAVGPYAPVVGGGAALISAANAGNARPPQASPSPGPTALSPNPLVAAAMGEGGTAGAPAPAPSAPPAAPGLANVIRQGNSYSGQPNISGDITINGKPPGGTFNALPGGPVPTSPPNPSPFGPTSSGGVPLIEAAGIRHSGNDWAARQNLKNLETTASSITNTRRWGGKGAEAGPDAMAYQQALATDAALQQAQPSLVQAMLRENAGLQREGMQQAGADRRSLVSAMLDQQRINQAGETAGYANRAAGQTEQLRSVLLDPNATPQQRQSAQQALMTLSGHQPADPYLVVPGGQQVDQMGRAYNLPSTVFNRSTGQFVQQPGQGAPTSGYTPTSEAIALLKSNPGMAKQFDDFYGAGAAQRALTGRG